MHRQDCTKRRERVLTESRIDMIIQVYTCMFNYSDLPYICIMHVKKAREKKNGESLVNIIT